MPRSAAAAAAAGAPPIHIVSGSGSSDSDDLPAGACFACPYRKMRQLPPPTEKERRNDCRTRGVGNSRITDT